MKPSWLLAPMTFVLLGLSACCPARVNILPKAAGEAEAISTSRKENCAIEKAQEKAEEYCKQQGKRYVVIDSQSKYQGADQTAKAGIQAVSTIASGGKRTVTGNTDEDYEVRLQFKCE